MMNQGKKREAENDMNAQVGQARYSSHDYEEESLCLTKKWNS